MIDLTIQFKLITFSLIFGFMFSILLDIFNSKAKKHSKIVEAILSFMLISFMTVIYFIGIKKIGDAIFHIYSIISIIVGFVLYNILVKIIANTNKR